MRTLRRLTATIALATALAGCAGVLTAGDEGQEAAPAPPRDPTLDQGGAPSPLDAAAPEAPAPRPDAAPPLEPSPGAPFVPAAPRLMRLTVGQYRNSLADLVGASPALDLEADTPLHGFAVIGGSELTISPLAAEQYEAAAWAAVNPHFEHPDAAQAFTGCPATSADCLADFFAELGRRAWRRPLTDAEIGGLVAQSAALGELLRDDWRGVGAAVAGLLQAPDFLFRVERGEDDGAGGRRLTAFELAARLAAVLWQSGPDDALLDAAAEGLLDTPAGLAAEAERLLADPRAERGVLGFFAEAFTLDHLQHLNKDRALFPRMSATLGAAMRGEIEALLRWLVLDEDADLTGLLTSRTVFINPELAALYGLPPVDGDGFTPVRLPDHHPRGGLLGSAGFLAQHAHATVTSPTFRGKAIQNHLLCFDIPPPPPGVATNLEADVPGAPPTTTREKLARHALDPTCNGCHQFMDPLGLALENFDAIGAWRTTEAGQPIDASGAFDGTPFIGGRALAAHLAASDRFAACQVRRFYRYALGHLEERGEEPAIAELSAHFAADGRRFRALVLRLVLHPAFRALGPLDPPDPEGRP